MLRRLSCHNKLELSVPPAPSLEEATDVTSSTSDVTSSNSTSHESSVSRLERLNEYESGYNSASTAAGDSQTSSSSTVVSSLPRVVVSQDCSHEEVRLRIVSGPKTINHYPCVKKITVNSEKWKGHPLVKGSRIVTKNPKKGPHGLISLFNSHELVKKSRYLIQSIKLKSSVYKVTFLPLRVE